VAAFLLAGGIFSLLLYLADTKNRANLYLVIITTLLIFYTISHILLFSAPDIESYVFAEKLANYIILVTATPFLLYIREFTGYKKNGLLIPLLLFFNSLFFFNYFSPYGLSYDNITEIRIVELPWGEKLSIPEVELSVIGILVIIAVFLILVYLFQAVKFLYKHNKPDARVILIAFTAILGTILIDYLMIALDLANFPYIQEFSYIIFLYIIATKNFRELMKSRLLEKKLFQSRENYRLIAENAGDIIYKVNSSFDILFVSQAVEKLLEYKVSELRGENIKSLVYEDDYSLLDESFPDFNKKLVCRVICKSGKIKWFETTFSVIAGHGSEEDGFILVSRDITEAKAQQEKILEHQNLLESILSSSPYILYRFNFDRMIQIYSHNHIYYLLGYTEAELNEIGDNPIDFLMPPDEQLLLDDYKQRWRNARDGEIVESEFRLRHKNGEYHWFFGRDIVFKRDENGNVTELLGTAQDITEIKKAQEDIINSERRLRAISEATFEGIAMSANGILIDTNKQFLDMHNFDFNDIIGKPVGYYLPENIREEIDRRMKNEPASIYRTYSRKKTGELFPVEIRARSVSYRGNNIRISVLRDISDQIKKENELLMAKEEAEKSDRLKSDFLTQMSHEIRSPIHTILSFAGFIREQLSGRIEEDIIDSLDSMDTAGRRITRTIDLILNMSQINTGTVEINKSNISLYDEVIAPILKEYDLLLKSRNNKINLEWKDCHPDANVFADEYSLKQIFQNLIDNANKYTENGTITISSECNGDRLLVNVIDTGVGISEKYLSKLFTPFSQEEQGYTRRYDGNGLGLALVKKYCDMNDLEISVTSEKGKGSCFTVVFRKKAPDETPAPENLT